MQTQHDDVEDVVGQGMIDLTHDQELVISETRLSLDVGLTRRFGASLLVPVRMIHTSIRYVDLTGNEVQLVTPGIHHRNETVTGIGDPMVLGAYSTRLGSLRAVARVGVTLPIGRTEDNPFTAEAEVTPHQHVQMGTGTVNPVIAGELVGGSGPWRVGAFVLTQQVVYENARGYHAGDRYAAGVTARRALKQRWSLRAGAEIQAETAERWDGIVHTDDGNRGRFDAMLTAGGSVAATDRLSFDLAIKVPVVTHAVGGQLDMPLVVELGAAWAFGATPRARGGDEHAEGEDHDHDHDHDHGDEHAHDDEHAHGDEHADADAHPDGDEHAHADEHAVTTDATATDGTTTTTTDGAPREGSAPPKPARPRPDIADLGKPGEAVPLVPVRGKLTIFDFWAAWCAPCKKLEPKLVELAKKYPDRVALRRIDVVDWDSAAAAKYLTPGGFDLPHVKIYDRAGKLVAEIGTKHQTLEQLVEQITRLVTAAAK